MSEADIRAIVDDAKFHRPVKHGDLFDAGIMPGDTILILDGLYHQNLALRHKEVIHMLSSDVRVVGASSIGALRAAELQPFGMIGIGEIFEWYVSGEVAGDDEVAVAHAPSGDMRAISLPLVNVRSILAAAVAEEITDEADSNVLLQMCRKIYYSQRTVGAIADAAMKNGKGRFSAWLIDRMTSDPHFGDQKRIDAISALNYVNANAHISRPHREDPALGDWRTGFFQDWQNFFATDAAFPHGPRLLPRVHYQQIFNPDFPQIWTKFLEYLSSEPAGDARRATLEDRYTSLNIGAANSSEMLPSAVRDMRTMVFRPRYNLTNSQHLEILLDQESELDINDGLALAHEDKAFRQNNRGMNSEWLREDVGRALLCDIWKVPEDSLEVASVGRGFRTERDATRALSQFVVGYLKRVHHQSTQGTVSGVG